MGLEQQHCVPCEAGVPKMEPEEADRLLQELQWRREGDWLERELEFGDFQQAMDFVQEVGRIAEGEGHHPDILLHDYKRVRLRLQTHAIGGLSRNDFILAAKIDRIHG